MSSFWATLAKDFLEVGPEVIATVWADKNNFTHESKVQAAGQAIVQASTVAKQIDAKDQGTIDTAQSLAESFVSAFQAPAPAPQPNVSNPPQAGSD